MAAKIPRQGYSTEESLAQKTLGKIHSTANWMIQTILAMALMHYVIIPVLEWFFDTVVEEQLEARRNE